MQYAAFISYSHEVDRHLSTSIERALSRFAKPWYKLRALRIFRDETDLSTAPRLWTYISRALDDSEFLIFLANPKAAKSIWIDRELEYWLTKKGPERLLVVLTDGLAIWDSTQGCFEPQASNAIPARLHKAFSEEPFYLDMRWTRAAPPLSLREPRFLDQIATMAASLHHRSKAELASTEVREHRRTIRIAWSVAIALATLTVVATTLGILAQNQRNVAQSKQREAEITLAQSDFLQGAQQISTDRASIAVPRLGRSLLLDPSRPATATRLTSLLMQRWFPRVVAEGPILSDAVTSLSFSRSGRFLVATSRFELHVWDALAGKPFIIPFKSEFRITHAEFSGDENWLLVTSGYGGMGGTHGEVRLWDLRVPQAPSRTIPIQGMLWTAKFAPDGKSFATASAFGIEFWSIPEGLPISKRLNFREFQTAIPEFRSTDNAFADFVFASEGTELIVVTGAIGPGVVARWNINDRKVIAIESLPTTSGQINLDENSPSVLLSFPNNYLETFNFGNVSREGIAIVLDRKTLKPKTRGMPHPDLISGIRYMPHGQLIFSGTEDGGLHLWNARSGAPVPFEGKHLDEVTSVDVAADGLLVASGAKDGTARVWNSLKTEIRSEPMVHSSAVSAVRFDPSGTRVASGTEAGRVFIWDITPQRLYPIRLDGGAEVLNAAISLDGTKLITCSNDGIVRIWATATAELLHKFEATKSARFHFAPMAEILIVEDGERIRLVDIKNSRSITDWIDLGSQVNQIAFDKKSNQFLTATEGGAVRLWDLNGATPKGVPLDHRGPVNSAVFFPNGNILTASGTEITVWDPRLNKRLKVAENVRSQQYATISGGEKTRSPNQIVDLRVTQDGKRILAVYGSTGVTLDVVNIRHKYVPEQVAIWSSDLDLVADIDGHRDYLTAITLSASGKFVATASRDGTVRIWSSVSGEPVRPPMAHSFVVKAVMFTGADERIIVSGKSDRVAIWRGWIGDTVPVAVTADSAVQNLVTGSPDGIFVTLSISGNLQVWEEETGEQLTDPLKVGESKDLLTVDASGETLAVVDRAGRSWVWRLPIPKDDLERCDLARTAEKVAGVRLNSSGAAVPLPNLQRSRRGYFDRCEDTEAFVGPLRQWRSLPSDARTIGPDASVLMHSYIRDVLRTEPNSSFSARLMMENPSDLCAQSTLANILFSRDASIAGIGRFLSKRLGLLSILNACN
jgi:WD40 repeat protein